MMENGSLADNTVCQTQPNQFLRIFYYIISIPTDINELHF